MIERSAEAERRTVKAELPFRFSELCTDTISKGLTINTTITSVATYGTPVSNLTWTQSGEADEQGNKIYTTSIPSDTVISLANAAKGANVGYTTLTLAYFATVNRDAIDYNTDTHENNKAHITYDNFNTADTNVDVYTYKFQLLKYDAAQLESGQAGTSAKPLGGAKFEIYRQGESTPLKVVPTDSGANLTHFRLAMSDSESGAVTQFTTVDGTGNTLQISGLDKNTTYTLREVEAPTGFNRLTQDVTIPTDTVAIGGVFAVANHQGNVLPSTGGIGTTIFYIAGGVIIICAAVLLIARRKKNA